MQIFGYRFRFRFLFGFQFSIFGFGLPISRTVWPKSPASFRIVSKTERSAIALSLPRPIYSFSTISTILFFSPTSDDDDVVVWARTEDCGSIFGFWISFVGRPEVGPKIWAQTIVRAITSNPPTPSPTWPMTPSRSVRDQATKCQKCAANWRIHKSAAKLVFGFTVLTRMAGWSYRVSSFFLFVFFFRGFVKGPRLGMLTRSQGRTWKIGKLKKSFLIEFLLLLQFVFYFLKNLARKKIKILEIKIFKGLKNMRKY